MHQFQRKLSHPHFNFGVKKLIDLDDSDDSSDSSDDDIDKRSVKSDSANYLVGFALLSVLELEGADMLGGPCLRRGNAKRDRSGIIIWSKELDDTMFRRQFRLHRDDFYYVLLKISGDLKKDEQKAINSSGSSISPYLMLMITLRMLAGASYLDMIHYHVHVDSVHSIVWETVCAITKNIDNIKIASTEVDFLDIARDWSTIQKSRWGTYLSVGTVYAGDGLVLEIQQPSEEELRGRAISIFRNRKGMWGLIAQGFFDAHTRFSVFDVRWPGGTNDIVAYNMSDLCALVKAGHFPDWATLILDEAYSSCGGMHLTPYSIHQLR